MGCVFHDGIACRRCGTILKSRSLMAEALAMLSDAFPTHTPQPVRLVPNQTHNRPGPGQETMEL